MSEPFKFTIDANKTLPEILQLVLQLRASIDALAVLVIETTASTTHADAVEVARRYEQMQTDFLLRHAFGVQESAGRQPPPRDENPGEP